MRFTFIHIERTNFTVSALCHAMQVTRSGYHAWATRGLCLRKQDDRVLAVHVVAAFARSRRTYGSPRIAVELQDQGLPIGRRRIARIMRETGIFARKKKAWRRSTGSCASERVAPNQLQRNFTTHAPNEAWVTDVKHVRTDEGWLYLAPVIDLFSRRIVGYAMSQENDGALALAAFESATTRRRPRHTVLLHSDRGAIYGEEQYIQRLAALGVKRSMSRKADPWDNAVIESFFSTLHFEFLSRRCFERFEDACRAISEWIDGFYNPQRRHSNNGNTSPIKYELRWQMRQELI